MEKMTAWVERSLTRNAVSIKLGDDPDSRYPAATVIRTQADVQLDEAGEVIMVVIEVARS